MVTGRSAPANLIGGAFVPARSGQVFVRSSPADSVVQWTVPASDASDVATAVDAAVRSQPRWAATSVVERGDLLRRAASLLEDRADAFVDAVCGETGKPRRDAVSEAAAAVEMAYFVAGEGRRFYGRTTTSAVRNKRVSIVRSPIGVAGLIVASNTPLPNYAWKVFPALLCGNAAVLKPSEDTPASAHLFAELMVDAGVPEGVLAVVHGAGPVAGAALVENPAVDVVSFTGSVGVGRIVGATAGGRLAKVCLELGGKNPLVVCEDADVPRAVDAATQSAFSNAGQRCAAGSRIIVLDAIYDEFRQRLVERTAQLVVGSDDEADLGPVINPRQLEHMLGAVDAACSSGARLLAGGVRLRGDRYDAGCYVAPTLLEGVAAGSHISRTELFGPIAVLHRAGSFDEAVELATDTPFGLTAAIWTSSIHRAMTFVERVSAGMVVINGPTFGSEPHMPFGGFRQSGNGYREAGTEALDVYSDLKTISIIHDPDVVN